MKTVITLFAIAITFSGTSQLLGFDSYQTTRERNFDSEKQYIPSEDSYEYVLLDGEADGISLFLFEEMWAEMNKIFSENGLSVPKGKLIKDSDKSKTTNESIQNAIVNGETFIMIRYELKNGYFVYLNLQDDFCGLAVTKEFID